MIFIVFWTTESKFMCYYSAKVTACKRLFHPKLIMWVSTFLQLQTSVKGNQMSYFKYFKAFFAQSSFKLIWRFEGCDAPPPPHAHTHTGSSQKCNFLNKEVLRTILPKENKYIGSGRKLNELLLKLTYTWNTLHSKMTFSPPTWMTRPALYWTEILWFLLSNALTDNR